MTTFNETFDKTTPAGTDAPSVIDDRIQEFKKAVQERENVDHYWPYASVDDVAGGNEVASKYTGEHRKVTLYENITDPPQVTGKGHIYMKGGELYYQDATNTTRKLTLAGALYIISADLLGKLANNTYFTAVDFAGTGTVDLIKANASDVPVLPDGSELATSDPPTEDAGIVNKAYSDTKEPKLVTQSTASIFGARTNLDSESAALARNIVYKVGSDGEVTFNSTTGNTSISVYTDDNNPPTTLIMQSYQGGGDERESRSFSVRKNDYWKISASGNPTVSIRWLPIGTGACVKQ